MPTQVQLQEELKSHGVELTGNESFNDLMKMAAQARKNQQGAQGGDSSKGGENPSANKKGNAVYVWLKSQIYVDKDGTKRLDAGLYQLKLSDYPRIKRGVSVVEIFDEEIPTRKLAEIARWCGVNPDAHRDDDELLEILVKEPRPFEIR